MRIKSLQLHGFKSFVDRTIFGFNDGITCVVGPNGCGKSNVVDAIRWVMGEQSPRRLRGKGMDDVIFAGSETRPPIGMAEIAITFDNHDHTAPAPYTEFEEIQISRRLYRSGESEYLINKTACRLRDIQDFFRDSGIGAKGYTIVEQGKVAELVSVKPEDRRILIEEAAGIGKFKARRRESESKIASTEQNLTRVNDVLGEIRRQISSLERQARKAARYKRLHESLRVVELSLAADERADLVAKVESAGARLTELKDQLLALESQISEKELAVENQRIGVTEAEKAVAAGSEKLFALRTEIKELESRIEFARRERESLEEANGGRREEIESLRGQRDTAQAQAGAAEAELRQIEEAVASDERTMAEALTASQTATQTQAVLERDREGLNESLVTLLTSIARAEDRLATVADRRGGLVQRLRTTEADLEQRQSQSEEATRDQSSLEEGLRNLLAERDRFQESLVRAMNRHEAAVDTERAAGVALRELRERLEARRARHASLVEIVERLEDVSTGTKHLIGEGDAARERFGLRGLVRELLEVDQEVERAVEAVLSDRAEALVVDDAGNALEAVRALRGAEAGRGLFFVPTAPAAASTGFVPLGQPLLDRVRPKPGYEHVARALFGEVYLVDSLADPVERYRGHRLPANFVTAEGDVLTRDGVVRGGIAESQSASGSFARAREVRELAQEVQQLEGEVLVAEQAHTSTQQELANAGDELENLRNRHHTAALAVANHEKDLDRSRERVKTLGEAQEGRVAERAELLAETEALGDETGRLERELEERRSERAEQQRGLDALVLKIAAGAREVSRFETRVAELRVAHEGRATSRDRAREQLERTQAQLEETAGWIERREREIEAANERRSQLGGEIEECESKLAERLEAEEAARIESEQLRESYDAKAGALREAEEAVRGVRAGLGAARDESSQAELAVRESELRLRHQEEAIREKWDTDLASWTPPPLDPEELEAAFQEGAREAGVAEEAAEAEADGADATGDDNDEDALMGTSAAQLKKDARKNAELARLPREEREKELVALRQKVQSLGDVNLGAIEEHEELAERFRFLSEQKQDLEATIESLRDAINRINRTSRKRFRETFEAVSKRFSENFPRLFGGGKASLLLTEAEDVLDAGVDIMAMPPGKRLQNVNLLSGGEKTMTALALLMSVFQVRPSPFFLLDEVDAALDDANVGRFNQLIKELADVSQFLVITHNKRTIEVADVLYGVTMEQKGVSKLVGVELH